MAKFNINIASISADMAIQRARNYKGAKNGLQVAIAWAVGQTMQGNADGLYQVFLAADLLSGGEKMTAYADGRAVWSYLTTSQSRGGCGLGTLIRWDKELSKFKMTEGWKSKAEDIDMVALVETLSETRWDTFKAVAVEKAFDLDKAIQTLITRAANKGISAAEVKKKLAEVAAA